MKIISDNANKVDYGVILTKDYDFGGECTKPILYAEEPNKDLGNAYPETCIEMPFLDPPNNNIQLNPGSVYILKEPQTPDPRNEVTFYSNLYYETIKQSTILSHWHWQGSNFNDFFLQEKNLINPQNNADATNECTDPTKQCIEEVATGSKYYTALYAQNNFNNALGVYTNKTCRVFTTDVSIIADMPDLLAQDAIFYKADIIPQK